MGENGHAVKLNIENDFMIQKTKCAFCDTTEFFPKNRDDICCSAYCKMRYEGKEENSMMRFINMYKNSSLEAMKELLKMIKRKSLNLKIKNKRNQQ